MTKQQQSRAIALEGNQFSTVMDTITQCMETITRDGPSACKMASQGLLEEAFETLSKAKCLANQQKERLSYLETLAVTDELTGLLNRRGFCKAMEKSLANARRYEEKGVLLFIDLDQFKPINDTYGHEAGDEVLKQTSRLLNDNIRDNDYAARMGGDEFAVLLVRTNWRDGQMRAKAIGNALNHYYTSWDGRMIGMSASIGTQVYDGSSIMADLLKHADHAMYQAKRRGTEPPFYLEAVQNG